MRVVVVFAVWLVTCLAHAQVPTGEGPPPEPAQPFVHEAPGPLCLGGECSVLAAPTPRSPYRTQPRARFAYAGAVLGSVSAGLVLASALSITLADQAESERITRGVWLGYVAVATPLVALSAWLPRKGSSFRGYPGVRRVGWLAYGAAVSHGVLLWYNALHGHDSPRYLTITSGVTGALALLPHALDALTSSRLARMRRYMMTAQLTSSGFSFRF